MEIINASERRASLESKLCRSALRALRNQAGKSFSSGFIKSLNTPIHRSKQIPAGMDRAIQSFFFESLSDEACINFSNPSIPSNGIVKRMMMRVKVTDRNLL